MAPLRLTSTLRVEGGILLGRTRERLGAHDADILSGERVCLVHSYTGSLGMWVAGEAICAAEFALSAGARSIETVIVCNRSDTAIEPALRRFLSGVEIDPFTRR